MLELTVRLVCSLALVVGLLLLIARFAGKRFQGRPGAAVRVIHRQPISRGSAVAVVTVGTRVLVLGTTEHQVTLLTEVEPDEVGIDVTDPDDLALLSPMQGGEPAAESPVNRGFPHFSGVAKAEKFTNHRLTGDSAAPTGPLAGSVLSPQTWKQALAAATRSRSAS